MGANPMQKMKRNSILIGVLIGLLIGLILCVILYMFLTKNGGAVLMSSTNEEMVEAYVLNQDVASGQIITSNMLNEIQVLKKMVPSNYVNSSLLSSIQLQDKSGNVLYRNAEGEYYLNITNSADYAKTTDGSNFVLVKSENNKYYVTRLSTNQKEYIEFTTVPTIAKINMKMNSIVTIDSLSKSNEIVTDDLREQEYNMITLPSELSAGEFIDIRLQLPNGGDYIVISKKRVLRCDASTIWLNMYEEEIELMSSAIIEYYIMTGSKLYATTYTEPGNQTAAVGTYVPNQIVSSLIGSNPNIKNYINSERYSEALKNIRNNNINASLNEYSDSALANIEQNMKEEIENLKESREAYFGTLNSFN